jgi:hypothetical protein
MSAMRVVACLGTSLAMAGILLAGEPAVHPGVYDLLVCKGPCTSSSAANVVARGVLVLAPETFGPESLSQLRSAHFERAYSIGGDPNGCFVLETTKEGQSFAGLMEFGLTLWRVHAGKVRFELYQSPDAWYFATLAITGDELRGMGGSSGGAGSDADITPDELLARRVGQGDVQACVQAATRQQQKPRRAA